MTTTRGTHDLKKRRLECMMKATFSGPLLRFVEHQADGYDRPAAYVDAQYNNLSSSYTYAELFFVLTDFQPNLNNQGIPITEKSNLITTARHKPVKISFQNGVWKGHADAVPVGTITDVLDEDTRLVAKAIIWKFDYPEVYETIKANQSDVYFSWELLYTAADEQDGITWLQGCELIGSTIVDNPAYGDRTPLLSVASYTKQGENMYEQNIMNDPSNNVPDNTPDNVPDDTSNSVPNNVPDRTVEDKPQAVVVPDDVVSISKKEFEELQNRLNELQYFYDQTQYRQRLAERYLKLSSFFDLDAVFPTAEYAEENHRDKLMSLTDDQFEFVLFLLHNCQKAVSNVQQPQPTVNDVSVHKPIVPDFVLSTPSRQTTKQLLIEYLKTLR